MNLLYIHTTPLKSEIANLIQVLSMCSAFSRIGVNTTLVLPDSGLNSKEAILYLKEKYGISSTFELSYYPVFTKFNRINKYLDRYCVKTIIGKINPDLIFVRNPIILKPCIKSGIPTIFEFHNSLLHNRIKIIDRLWKKQIIKLSEHKNLIKLITISDALKDFWINSGIEEAKLLALHDGFNFNLFKTLKSRKEARQKLGLNLEKKIVIYTGYLTKDRKIENIIKLAIDFKYVEFIIAGGPEKNSNYFADYVKKNKIRNIHFLGFLDHKEIPDYLYAADILLAIFSDEVPTINYCSPLKVFEYMAAGRIIVAHDFPTIAEVLKHNETAFLVTPNSYNSLHDAVESALRVKYPSKMAEKVRLLALEKYTWKLRAEKILEDVKL